MTVCLHGDRYDMIERGEGTRSAMEQKSLSR